VNRLISNATAFVFGLIFAAVLFLAALPKAHGAEPAQQIMVVIGYQKGEPQGAEVVGFALNLSACQQGLVTAMTVMKPKPGISLVAMCTPLPPAPKDPQHES
jgi:hypothetical protein